MTIGSSGLSPDTAYKIENKGFIRSQVGAVLAASPVAVASCGVSSLLKKVSQVSKEENAQLNKAAQNGLKLSGLYKKGVRIFKFQEVSHSPSDLKDLFKKDSGIKYLKKDQKALNAIKEECQSKSFAKFLTKLDKSGKFINRYIERMTKKSAKQIKTGNNAGYLTKANKIIMPDKSFQTSAFHEMGHALNANGNNVLKALQKCRPLAMTLPAYILLVSLLNKRKVNDQTNKNDSFIQKSADFIKRHAPSLTALSMIPVVAEESIASIRGGNIAKQLLDTGKLSKELFKKIQKTNAVGLVSYLLAVLNAVLIAKFAVKIKDKIQDDYEQKENMKFAKYNYNLNTRSMHQG